MIFAGLQHEKVISQWNRNICFWHTWQFLLFLCVNHYREESIALSILRLIELEKAVVEGAGAVGLAAIMQESLPELAGKTSVFLWIDYITAKFYSAWNFYVDLIKLKLSFFNLLSIKYELYQVSSMQ